MPTGLVCCKLQHSEIANESTEELDIGVAGAGPVKKSKRLVFIY